MKEKYKIVVESAWPELMESVNMRIQDGWVPLGGVAISNWTSDSGDCLSEYAQAMVKPGLVAVKVE